MHSPSVKTFNGLHFKVRCNAVYITGSYHQKYSVAFILINSSALTEQAGIDFKPLSDGFKDAISYILFLGLLITLVEVIISKTSM